MGFRLLEQRLIAWEEGGVTEEEVLDALSDFQNDDGGFGKGLEPDFLLPDSSPMATSIGLRILDGLPSGSRRNGMIAEAIQYLWQVYDPKRPGWWAVPKTVNAYPHAPWWDWLEEIQGTVIDAHWGNPNAEIVGYLFKYDNDARNDNLIRYAFDHFMRMTDYASEHELFCYLRFCETVQASGLSALKEGVKAAVATRVEYAVVEWAGYVPKPLDFLRYTRDNWIGIDENGVDANLEWLRSQLDDRGYIDVNWEWGRDEEHFNEAREMWRGILSWEAIRLIRCYGGRS